MTNKMKRTIEKLEKSEDTFENKLYIVCYLVLALGFLLYLFLPKPTLQTKLNQEVAKLRLPAATKSIQSLKTSAKHIGFLVFYEGNNPRSLKVLKQLVAYHSVYGFAVTGVSMDGVLFNGLPNNRLDEGEAMNMGILSTPSLFVVNPETGNKQQVALSVESSGSFQAAVQNAITKLKHMDTSKHHNAIGYIPLGAHV